MAVALLYIVAMRHLVRERSASPHARMAVAQA
jgi:hypothetical protein